MKSSSGKKPSAKGQVPPQELEVSPHSGLYLLDQLRDQIKNWESYIRKCKYRPATTTTTAAAVSRSGSRSSFFNPKQIFLKNQIFRGKKMIF